MKRATNLLMLAAVIGFGGVSAVLAQGDRQSARQDIQRANLPGRTVFDQQCAPCHGTGPGDDGSRMLPGTAALAQKYQGQLPAELELRSDLGVPVLRMFVRRGSGAMPMFRAAELTDAQIEEIAAYIAATSQATNAADAIGGPDRD